MTRCPTGRGDDGAAVVDFALVGALLTVLFVALLQLMVVLYVRATLIDCAARGAAHGARAGSATEPNAATADAGTAEGAARTRQFVEASVGRRYAGAVSARRVRFAGLDTLEVRIEAPLPVAGMLGTGRVLSVRGHAVLEPAVLEPAAGPR